MANEEQLKILKQGVEVWNQWREEHPDEELDLSGANLYKAVLFGINLSRTNLSWANLVGAKLVGAKLHEANLHEVSLIEGNLIETDLSGANLNKASLKLANLVGATLSRANLTGACLYGTAQDNWNIEGIQCDYVFWDSEGKERTPKDRNFRPGEFEELYKQLPTFTYYFEQGFTAVDAVVMDQVVQTINQQNPEYEVKLTTLDSRGQPHAVFTVVHKDHVEAAQHQVTTDFEQRLAALEGKQEQMMELFARIADNPKTIELIMGDKRMIQAGRDYLEQVAGDVTTGESANASKQPGEREDEESA